MKKRFSLLLTSIISLVLAVVFISGCSFINTSTKNYGAYTGSDSLIAAQSVKFNTTEKTRDIEDALVEAVAKVERSSVQILTEVGTAGSGVIIDISWAGNGDYDASWKQDDDIVYIITCHHMVSKDGTYGTEGVGWIEVIIPDEDYSYNNLDYVFDGYIGNGTPSEYESQGYAITLVGGDFESDIALLKLNLNVAAKSGKKLSVDKIVKSEIPNNSGADSYTAKRGETVFSVGNPTGMLPGSVATGVISYLTRESTVSVSSSNAILLDMTLIQIAVPTNEGSSGGGLYNLYGELIGITNAGASKNKFEGINFAIPCYLEDGNGFVQIAAQLLGTATENNYGYVSGRKVNFGFTYSEDFIDGNSVVYVESVVSGSIAARQGLQKSDRIVSIVVNRGEETIESKNVSTLNEFATIINNLEAGDSISLTVKRTVRYYNWWYEQTETINMMTESFLFCNTGK